MLSWMWFWISVGWFLGFSCLGCCLLSCGRRVGTAVFIVGVVGGFVLAGVGKMRCSAAIEAEAAVVADNPRKWLADEVSDVGRVSMSGVLTLIDAKKRKFRQSMGDTDDKERLMVLGAAVDALDAQEECLRRMRSPAKCLVE